MSCSTLTALCHNRSFQSFAFLFIPDEILQTSLLGSYIILLFFSPRPSVLTGCPAPQQKKAKSPSLRLLLCPHLPGAFPTSAVHCCFIFFQPSGKPGKLFSFSSSCQFFMVSSCLFTSFRRLLQTSQSLIPKFLPIPSKKFCL